VLDSLQSITSPWEEIPKDSPSEGNPCLDLENPNEEMANIPQPSGNELPPPPRALPPWLT